MKLTNLSEQLISQSHIEQLEQACSLVDEIEVRIDDFPDNPRDEDLAGDSCLVIKSDFPATWEAGESDCMLYSKQGFSDITWEDVESVLQEHDLKLNDVVALTIQASHDVGGAIRLSTVKSSLKHPDKRCMKSKLHDVGFIYATKDSFDFGGLEVTEEQKEALMYEDLAYQVDYLDRFINNNIYEINIFEADSDRVMRRGSVINDKSFDAVVDELIWEYNFSFSPEY